MNEPDDFGLSPLQSLAHTASTRPISGHSRFWRDFAEEVESLSPTLRPPHGDEIHPGVTHIVESVGSVRIGCRVDEPAVEPAGVVVVAHGSEVEREIPPPEPLWRRAPLVIVRMRCRGYPGSHMDLGDLTSHDTGWITVGLERPDSSILRGATADVVNVVRAASRQWGLPIAIRAESLGAGLAVIASAQAPADGKPARLAVGLPSLADWRWRLERPATLGMGGQIQRFMAMRRDQEREITRTLRHFDAVVHAKRVRCPVLCKLAERDDVVPAPTAAAVYNALGTEPGRKSRFITRYGHFDGGLADARRHAMFERLAVEFLNPDATPTPGALPVEPASKDR